MKSKRLPIVQPPVVSYLHHAYLLAIALCDKRTLPWFYSNYIQLRCFKDITSGRGSDYFNFYNYDFAVHQWPSLLQEKVGKSFLERHSIGFRELACRAIENGQYVYAYFDHYYVPGQAYHKKKRITGDGLVFGADLQEGVYHYLGFNEHEVFGERKISMDELDAAFKRADDSMPWQKSVFLFQPNLKGEYVFDVRLVVSLLKDYLYGRNTSERFAMFQTPLDSRECYFGVKAYELVTEFLEKVARKSKYFDIRPLHVLLEHKKGMAERMAYMEKERLLSPLDRFAEQFGELEKLALQARNDMIKFRMTDNKQYIEKIIQSIELIRRREVELLPAVIEKLEDTFSKEEVVI